MTVLSWHHCVKRFSACFNETKLECPLSLPACFPCKCYMQLASSTTPFWIWLVRTIKDNQVSVRTVDGHMSKNFLPKGKICSFSYTLSDPGGGQNLITTSAAGNSCLNSWFFMGKPSSLSAGISRLTCFNGAEESMLLRRLFRISLLQGCAPCSLMAFVFFNKNEVFPWLEKLCCFSFHLTPVRKNTLLLHMWVLQNMEVMKFCVWSCHSNAVILPAVKSFPRAAL